ncbi:hypothetical protein K9L16_02515 [Candidatus Pacearchaeota archaeon]|nr:hypothetical protein [Candidatus Pacearchaeota archaeon]
MALSFNYHKLPNKKGTDTRTPTIPILLKGNSKTEIQVYALIDSGADVSVIPKALAEFLDLDLSGDTSISYGIGGEIKVKESKMRVMLKEPHGETYNYLIPVQVVLSGEEPPIILGRAGFFNKFIITIDEDKQKIKLKKVNRKY